MPGEFIQEVHIFPCVQSADGGVGYCSEITETRVPFGSFDESEDSSVLGWRQAEDTHIRIPLKRLAEILKKSGITLSYDEVEQARPIDSKEVPGE